VLALRAERGKEEEEGGKINRTDLILYSPSSIFSRSDNNIICLSGSRLRLCPRKIDRERSEGRGKRIDATNLFWGFQVFAARRRRGKDLHMHTSIDDPRALFLQV